MKKLLKIAAVAALAASCSQGPAQKVLVLYYSQNGTTQTVAEEISSRLGADIEAIVPVNPYDGDFHATIERGGQELREGILPEIQPLAADISAYDVIFIGYPVWFGTCALPVKTLLFTTDFSGKKLVPFCTFGSGGLDSSSRDIQAAQPEAEILPGYGVRAARIEAVPGEIDLFLKAGGFIEGEFEALGEFGETHPVSDEEAAIFNDAVGDYPMMHACAEEASYREVPGGVEYLFTARDLPRDGMDSPFAGTIKVYVLVEDGKAPVFTQVVR